MLLIVKISKPIEISVGICIYALHTSFTSSGTAYSVLVAWQLFTVTSLVVALHCSAPRRVLLPVPLSFSPSLPRVRYFYVSASHTEHSSSSRSFFFSPLSLARLLFNACLACLCGHGLVRANRHVLPAMLCHVRLYPMPFLDVAVVRCRCCLAHSCTLFLSLLFLQPRGGVPAPARSSRSASSWPLSVGLL